MGFEEYVRRAECVAILVLFGLCLYAWLSGHPMGRGR